MGKTFRGIWELYDDDPEAADAKIWGRHSEPISRRGFLAGSGIVVGLLESGRVLAKIDADQQSIVGPEVQAKLAEEDRGFVTIQIADR